MRHGGRVPRQAARAIGATLARALGYPHALPIRPARAPDSRATRHAKALGADRAPRARWLAR